MKNIFLLILIVASYHATYGQDDAINEAADPAVRQRIRAAHAAYITERIELSSSEAEKFWPVYREYLEKRKKLRDSIRDARRTDKNEKELLELDLQVKQHELDLEKEYTMKLEKIISAEKLIRLRQAEVDFRKLLLRQLQERRRQRK